LKFSLVTYALGCTASAALMAGCSSSGGSSFGTTSGVTPSGVHSLRTISINGLLITAAHPNLRMRSHVTRVTPDKHREEKGLYQYVSSFYNSELVEFDYPKGDTSIDEISADEPQGECGDVLYGAAKRDFWVVNSGSDDIDEFAVGGIGPIKILSESTGEAAVLGDHRTHNRVVTPHRLLHRRAVALLSYRAAFDIGEGKRHGTGWKRCCQGHS
jgi:hypothetical protein